MEERVKHEKTIAVLENNQKRLQEDLDDINSKIDSFAEEFRGYNTSLTITMNTLDNTLCKNTEAINKFVSFMDSVNEEKAAQAKYEGVLLERRKAQEKKIKKMDKKAKKLEEEVQDLKQKPATNLFNWSGRIAWLAVAALVTLLVGLLVTGG